MIPDQAGPPERAMQHWWQLGTRNWRTKPGRACTTVIAIALGVAMIVTITCCYASLVDSINQWQALWLGKSEIRLQNNAYVAANISQANVEKVRDHPTVGPKIRHLAVRLREFVSLTPPPGNQKDRSPRRTGWVEAYGIMPPEEYELRTLQITRGRLLRADDTHNILVQSDVVEKFGYDLGDEVLLKFANQTVPVHVVGIVKRLKVGSFQKGGIWLLLPTLQELTNRPGKISEIDLILSEDASLEQVRRELEKVVDPNVEVSSADRKAAHLRDGTKMMDMLLQLTSMISLLAAGFIIFSTLNMGVMERMSQLGVMRCVGLTRAQLALLVFSESMPLGALGVVLGLPTGILLSSQAVRLSGKLFGQEVFGEYRINVAGLVLAATGGLIATAVASLVPAINASRVSPLEATRPMARQSRFAREVLAAVIGVVLIGLQTLPLLVMHDAYTIFVTYVFVGVPLLVTGYVLFTPLLIAAASAVLTYPLGWLLRIRPRLLVDQIGKAHWRGAGVCAAMMVGVALVVELRTNTSSILARWDLPSTFPDAVIWSMTPMEPKVIDRIKKLRGIGLLTSVSYTPVKMADAQTGRGIWGFFLDEPQTHFLAFEPEKARDIIELEFLEGDAEQAWYELEHDNGLLVTEGYCNTYNKKVGDPVRLRLARGPWVEFKIAAVVRSPGMEVAVDWFDQRQMYERKAVGAVMGTRRQAIEYFGETDCQMLLLRFDYPPDLSDDKRERFGNAVFLSIRNVLNERDYGTVFYVTAQKLMDLITRDFNKATLWLAFAASVTIVVAGLGAANVMLSNIISRRRQLAVLRAVGTTRWQIVRLVLGEAMLLGLVGSGLGVLHGFHLAAVANHLYFLLFGIAPVWRVPWGGIHGVAAATVFAFAVCLIAAIVPARSAARSNVIAAMQA